MTHWSRESATRSQNSIVNKLKTTETKLGKADVAPRLPTLIVGHITSYIYDDAFDVAHFRADPIM